MHYHYHLLLNNFSISIFIVFILQNYLEEHVNFQVNCILFSFVILFYVDIFSAF